MSEEKPKATKKTTAPEPTAAEYQDQYRSTVEELNAQPKVRVRLYQVPKDSSDEPLPDQTVAVNGHVYQMQRGVSVEVPQTVADILEEAGHI